MSVDGYVAGPSPSLEHPLAEGGEALHRWAFATRRFRALHGGEGGEDGPDDDVVGEMLENVGATIMGRRMFGGGPGPWGAEPWNGWWGEDPPFRTPVLVLTHHARDPLPMRGGTTFHFVTEGIEAALERAVAAARGRDVSLGGGADAAQQHIAAGLVDEMAIHVVPVLLGGGPRLFEATGGRQAGFELVRALATPAAAHYTYRRAG